MSLMRNVITVFILFVILLQSVIAQDVVFPCNGNNYTIKSSSWPTPKSSSSFKRFMTHVNLKSLQLPFAKTLDSLESEVRRSTGFSMQQLRLKEVIMFNEPEQANYIGELRYKLKITPYYYVPVIIGFNQKGELANIHGTNFNLNAGIKILEA